MPYSTLLFTIDGPVATLTFNRPDKLNALNREMFEEISDVLDKVNADTGIRVLLLTGAGRAFIAGADISTFLELDTLSARQFSSTKHAIGSRIEGLEIPTIACVNGFALGGGLEVAMLCDIIYASDQARFGQPEINLGILPGFGGTQRLSRLVGRGLARELCLTGRHIDAAEAKAMGIAAQVFPHDKLMEECLKIARTMAEKSRGALKLLKHVINRGFDVDLATALSMEADAWALCFASPDAHEGARAFLEKRQPKFV